MPNRSLQTAKRGDAAALAALARRLVEAGLPPAWTPARVERAITDPDHCVLVAHEGRTLVGGGIVEWTDTAAHLGQLVVATGCQRTGLGRALLEALERAAHAAGFDRVRLEIREGNSRAQQFYQAAGYRETGRHRRYYDDREDALVMVRDLRAVTAP